MNPAMLPMLDVLKDDVLRRIAAEGNIGRYPARAVLITEGDTTDSLFIVLSGRVKVYASNPAGKEIVLGTHGPGEYLGELALDGGPRSASVMTLEPTACAVVNGASLREFIAAHPEFALHLINKLIRRTRVLTRSVKRLALEDVYCRVVGLLMELSRVEGERRVVSERLTQQDIADQVGASREMVSRTLSELVFGGYLSVERRQYTINKTPPPSW